MSMWLPGSAAWAAAPDRATTKVASIATRCLRMESSPDLTDCRANVTAQAAARNAARDYTGITTQRCLVTGADRGLGLAFVTQLLERGAHVLACCRDPAHADVLAALQSAHGERLVIHALDVADPRAIEALPQAAARHLQRIDLLINNAGVLVSGERFGNVKAESLAMSFAVNASAPLLITQALAPLLARGNKPRVLCISTQLASIAQASSFRTLSYAMSRPRST